MRRILTCVVSIITIICLLCACGNSQKETTAVPTPEASTAIPSPSPSPSPSQKRESEPYTDAEAQAALDAAGAQAMLEIELGEYDGSVADRIDEILEKNEAYQAYLSEKDKESTVTQPPTPPTEPQASAPARLYVDPNAQPWLFQIDVEGIDEAPDWVDLFLYVEDGSGCSREESGYNGGSTTCDEVCLMFPGEVSVEVFMDIRSDYIDGEIVEYDIDTDDAYCTFPLEDWAFEEYINNAQKEEIDAWCSVWYDPNPDNYSSEDIEYMEYSFSAEVFIRKLDYYY